MMYNPYNSRNRLFTRKDIELILGHGIKDQRLYQTAMVHSSYVRRLEYTTPSGEISELAPCPPEMIPLFENSYEKLEHLGDSILGCVVSTYLSKRFPEENEGFLTDLKKEIVCNDALGALTQKIGLDKFYIISRHNEDACEGRRNLKKLGDILEAFIGALWTDSENNFSTVYNFIVFRLIEKYINIPKILLNNRNFKEQLQKYCQGKFKFTPTYLIISNLNNEYTMAAIDNLKNVLGTGTATVKKQAEQLAAKHALEQFKSV